jgi:hypothetical protein
MPACFDMPAGTDAARFRSGVLIVRGYQWLSGDTSADAGDRISLDRRATDARVESRSPVRRLGRADGIL